MLNELLTVSKPDLLDKDGDRAFRELLYDFFAFGRSVEAARSTFASFAGLSTTQYLILIAIGHSTSTEPLGVNQLAERLYLSGAFVTNEINGLVSEGLIEKRPHPSDGRRVQLGVTELGVSKLTRLAALQRPVNDAMFGILSRDEFRTLSVLLSRLASNGDSAVKLAEHVQATLTFQEHHSSSQVKVSGSRRKKVARRHSAR